MSGLGLDTDPGAARTVLLLLGLLIEGGRRLRHLMFPMSTPSLTKWP